MGLDSAQALCNRHPEIEAYFIYEAPDGTLSCHFANNGAKLATN